MLLVRRDGRLHVVDIFMNVIPIKLHQRKIIITIKKPAFVYIYKNALRQLRPAFTPPGRFV